MKRVPTLHELIHLNPEDLSKVIICYNSFILYLINKKKMKLINH